MVKYTQKFEKQKFSKTKKQRGGLGSASSKKKGDSIKKKRIAERILYLREKQKFRRTLDQIVKLRKEEPDKSSKDLYASTLTEKEILDNYNNFCEQELAVISTTFLKEDWRTNYDHLYENPSTPFAMSLQDEIKVKQQIKNKNQEYSGILLKKEGLMPKHKSVSKSMKIRSGGYYINSIHNNESVKKIINLFNYIASETGKTIKIRETVISRFMFMLRLSSLRNSQTDWPALNESNNLIYTNAMILFITINESFDVFTLLEVPELYKLTTAEKRSYSEFVNGLTIRDLTPDEINKIKIYTGPSNIKTNDLTSAPEIAFGYVGIQGALSPFSLETINDTYNTATTIKNNLKDFLNGKNGESASSNQKSQCVLLSVILYVLSKISAFPQDGERIDEHDIYDERGNFKQQAFKNKMYSSSDLESTIIQYQHNTSSELGNFYQNVCKSNNDDVIPYNALISFNINHDTTYVHKSFVSSIKPVIKELIYNVFSTLRLNNSGIILPKNLELGELRNTIIDYKRDNLDKSDFNFLQTNNIIKTDNNTMAKYNKVKHEIINEAIPNYPGINITLNNVSVSNICNTVATMSYLAYLPTYHVATYDFNDLNLKYFGAYDPDPDCIRLTNVPELTINNKKLRELGNTVLDKRLKENYKYSYHRIHVWINKDKQLIYFAIRGTHSSRDWQHSDYLVARGEGHRMERVDIIDDVLRQVYSDMVGIWKLGSDVRPSYKLIITGHSLGGNLTNITKVLTHKNRLYGFTDTFTNGFPISCQPYYSSKDHSDEHFKILNWAFSNDKGLVLNIERDGAAETLIKKAKANKISNNLIIFQATRTTKQKPPGLFDYSLIDTVFYMGFTHSLYNFFGKATWEKIMNHHTSKQLLINGNVIDNTPKACLGKLILHDRDNEGVAQTTEITYIKYGNYEFDSDMTIDTDAFILTTNLAFNNGCQLQRRDKDI